HYPMEASLSEMGGGSWSCDVRSLQKTGYPLHVMVRPGSEILIRITYFREYFDSETVSRMLGHYQALLENIPSCAPGPLAEVKMLPNSERRLLLEEWNNTAADFPLGVCMHQMFETCVARMPDVIAAVCEDRFSTYRDLNGRANRLARALVERGVGADSIVALLGERSLDFLTAVLAVFKAGGAYLPLDPRHPAARWQVAL